jgi:8-amino-7-oxononanoate synthase
MDGDFAPLKTIAALCEKFDAALIVDEAHATGIFGPRGEGRVVDLGLSNKCFARIHTFSKAIGAHGAAVVGSEKLKQFLINYSRPFIYSTALPVHTLVAIRCAYEYLQNDVENRLYLLSLIGLFKQEMSALKKGTLLASESAIQSVVFSGSAAVKEVAAKLQNDGFDIRPIVYPTVPQGKERIRICLHSFNQLKEIVHLAKTLQSL